MRASTRGAIYPIRLPQSGLVKDLDEARAAMLLAQGGQVLIELFGQPGCCGCLLRPRELLRRRAVGTAVGGLQRGVDEPKVDAYAAAGSVVSSAAASRVHLCRRDRS